MPETPKFIPAVKNDLGFTPPPSPEYVPTEIKTDFSTIFNSTTSPMDLLDTPLASYKLADLGAARFIKSKYFTEPGGSFSMFRDNESAYYDLQTGSDIFWNRINRWRSLTADTFATHFQYDDKLKSLVNSDMSEDQGLLESAELHKELEDIYPIFRNPDSQGVGLASYFGKGAGQKWGEIFEQTAFTAGIVAGGIVETLALAAITAELGGAAGWANAPKTIGAIINSVKKFNDIKKLASVKNLANLTSLGKITQGASLINKGSTGWGITKITMGALQSVNAATSEAMIEGIHNAAEFTEAKVEEYKKANNGQDPPPEEMEKIVSHANGLYASTFYPNIPMLMVSNALQEYGIFGIQKGIFGALTKGTITEGSTEATTLAGKKLFYNSTLGKFVTKAELSTSTKFKLNAKNLLRPFLFEPLSEGLEELGQLVIQKGAYDYYNKKFSLTNEDIGYFEALGQGLSAGFEGANSDEGTQNFWAGVFGGAMYMGPTAIIKGAHASLSGKTSMVNSQAKEMAHQLNQGMSDALRLEFANDASTLNTMFQDRISDEIQEAISQGKSYEVENLKHASLTEAVATAVRTGKVDSFIQGIEDKAKMPKSEFEAFLGRELRPNETVQENISNVLSKIEKIQRVVEAVDNIYPQDNLRTSKRFAKYKAQLEKATPEESMKLTEKFMEEIASYNATESARRIMVHQLSSIDNVENRRAHYDDRLRGMGLTYDNSKMLFNEEAFTEKYKDVLSNLSSLRDRLSQNKKTLSKLDPKKDKAQINALEIDNEKLSKEIDTEDKKSDFLDKHRKGDIALRRKHKLGAVPTLSVDEAENRLESYYKDLSKFLEDHNAASVLSELFNKETLTQGVYTFNTKQAIAALIDSSKLDHDVLYQAELFKMLSNKTNFNSLVKQFTKDNAKYQKRIATLGTSVSPVPSIGEEEEALPEEITFAIIQKDDGTFEVVSSDNVSHGAYPTEEEAKLVVEQLELKKKEEQLVPPPVTTPPPVVREGVQIQKNEETKKWTLTQEGNTFTFNTLQQAKDFLLDSLNKRLTIATEEAEIAFLYDEIAAVEKLTDTPPVSFKPGTRVFFEGNPYTVVSGRLEDGVLTGPYILKNEDGNTVLQNSKARLFSADVLSLTPAFLEPLTPTTHKTPEGEFEKVPAPYRRLADRINAGQVTELKFIYQPYSQPEKVYTVTNLRTLFENNLWYVLADKVLGEPNRKFRISPDPTDDVNQRFKKIIDEKGIEKPPQESDEITPTQEILDTLASQLRAQYNTLIPGAVLRTTSNESPLTDKDSDSLSYKRMLVKNALLLKTAQWAYNISGLGYQLKIQKDREDLTDDLEYFNKVKDTPKHPVVVTIVDSEGNEVKFLPTGERDMRDFMQDSQERISQIEASTLSSEEKTRLIDEERLFLNEAEGIKLSFNILSTDRNVDKLISDRAKYFKSLSKDVTDQDAKAKAKEAVESEMKDLETLKAKVREGESFIIPSGILSRGFEDNSLPHRQMSLNDSTLTGVDVQVQMAATTFREAGRKVGVSYVKGRKGSIDFVSPIYMPSINSPGIKELIIKLVTGENKDFANAPEIASIPLRTEFLQNILYLKQEAGIEDVTRTQNKIGLKLGKKQYANSAKEVEEVLNRLSNQKLNINQKLLTQGLPFTWYKMEGNEIIPVKFDNYSDFIRSIATISVPERLEELSQNVNKNIVLSFNPNETKIVAIEAEDTPPAPVKTDKKSTSRLASKSGLPKKNKLLRAKEEVDHSAPMSQEEISWMEKTFSLSGRVRFLKDVVNSDAWGQWTKAGIKLFSDAISGTGYHEAWHEFSQLYLTKKEKMALYKEVTENVREFNGMDYTDFFTIRRIEEFLADDFMAYKLSNSSLILKGRPERNSLFRKILNFLKKMFGVENFQDKIDRLYKKLSDGKLSQKHLKEENIIFTSPLDRTKIPGFAELALAKDNPNKLLKATLEWFDFVIADELYNNNTVEDSPGEVRNQRLNILDLFTNGSLKIKGYQAIQTEIDGYITKYENELEEAEEDDIEQFTNIHEYFKFLRDNFQSFSKLHGKLNTLGLEDIDKTEILFDEEGEIIEDERNEEQDEDNRGKDAAWTKVGNENYSRDIASKQVKFMLKTLPQLEVDPDYDYLTSDPKDKYRNVVNDFGFDRNVNFERIWATLANKLEGILDPHMVYKKIEELIELEPAFGVLLNRLPPIDSGNIHDVMLLNRFLQDFKFFNKKIMVTQIEIKEDGTVSLRNIHGSNNADKSLATDMREEMKKKASDPSFPLIKETTKGAYLDLEEAIKYYHAVLPFLDEQTLGHKRARTNFLRQLGFIISPKTENSAEFQDYIAKSMGDRADSRAKGIIPNIMNFLREYKGMTGENEEYDLFNLLNKGHTDPRDKKKKVKGLSNDIKKLLNFELIYSDQYIVNSVYDANNKLVYENSYYSMAALNFNALNDFEKYKTFQDILKDPSLEASFNPVKNTWVKHSVYMNSLFELQSLTGYGLRKRVKNTEEYVRINLNNYSGLSIKKENEEASVGKTTTDMFANDKIFMDIINVVTKGKSPLLRNADKSSENEVGLTQYSLANKFVNNPVGTGSSSIVRESLEHLSTSDNEYKIFENYLLAELKRIYKIKHLSHSKDVFNIKGANKGVSVLERGSDFILFDSILSPSTKNTLLSKLASLNFTEYSPEAIEAIEDFVIDEEFKTLLASEIGAFLENEVEEYKKEFRKYGYTAEILEYYFQGLDPEFSKKEQEIMRSYVLNQRIHFVEQTITVFGDPMYFADPFKRFPYAASSIGTSPHVYQELTDFFNNKDPNYRLQAKLLGAPVRPYDEKVQTSVLHDVETVVPATVVGDWMKALKEQGASPSQIEKIKKIYTNAFVEPDAQGICTLDFYRIVKLALGYWYPRHENAYRKLLRKEKLTVAEYALFAPQKLGYSGPIEHKFLAIPGYHKFSLIPILPITSQSTNILALNEKMLREGLDYVTFESGSKLGILANSEGTLDSLYTESPSESNSRDINPAPFTITKTFIKFYKEQVQIEPKKERESLFGTQFRKLLFSNKFENGIPIDYKGDKDFYSLSDEQKLASSRFYRLEKTYQDNIRTIRDHKASILFGKLGINKDANIDDMSTVTEINSEKLVELLEDEVMKRNYPESILEFFEVDPSGKFKYPLESSVNKVLLQKILLSLINNDIVKQKTPGQQMVQAAQTGYEFKFDKLGNKLDEANTLQPYRIKWNGEKFTILPMEVMVSFSDSYKPLLSQTHLDGAPIRSIRRLNDMMEDEEFRDTHEDLLSLIGYRIPTQALSSMENMTIRKFLPAESMNVIIVPSIITQKAGSDFDIDKLNILRPGNVGNIYEEDSIYLFAQEQADAKEADLNDPKKNLSKSKRETLKKEIEELRATPKTLKIKSTQQARIAQNDIIRIAKEIMSSSESLVDLLTPNSVDIIKGIADGIRDELKIDSKKKYKTDLFSAITNIQVFNSFLGGAATIGIAAIANTMAQQFMRSGAKFNTFYQIKTVKGNKITPRNVLAQTLLDAVTEPITIAGKTVNRIILSSQRDSTGQYLKSELFSQYISAYVDVAKEPFIFNMNGGKSVAPVLMLMAHMGVPVKQAAYLANQPIVREYISKRLEQEGLIATTYASVNKAVTEKDDNEVIKFRVAVKLLKEHGLEVFGEPSLFMVNINKQQDKRVGTHLLKTNSLVMVVQKAPMSKELYNDIQQAALIEFLSLEEMSSAVREEMEPLKFDTDPISSVLSASDRATKLSQLLSTEESETKAPERKYPTLLSKSSLHKIARESEISPFNVADLVTKLYLDKYDLISSPVVQKEWENLSSTNLKVKNNKKHRETVARVWENDLVMFALQNYKEGDYYLVDDILSLITTGRNNIVTRLVSLKSKHPELLKVFPILSNLKEITSPKKTTDLQSLSWYGPKLTTELIEEYKSSWKEALSYSDASPSTNQEIQEFFKDLVAATILTHGLSKSPNSFTELIPEEAHISLILPAIQQMAQGLKDPSSTFYEKFQGYNTLFKRNNRRYMKGSNPVSDGPVKQYKFDDGGSGKYEWSRILSPYVITNEEKTTTPTIGTDSSDNSRQALVDKAKEISRSLPEDLSQAILEEPLETLEGLSRAALQGAEEKENLISHVGKELVDIALALFPAFSEDLQEGELLEDYSQSTGQTMGEDELPPWEEQTPEETFNKTEQRTLKSKKFIVFLQSEREKNPNVTLRAALEYYKKCKE